MFVLLPRWWQGDIYNDEVFPYPQEALGQAKMKARGSIHLPTRSCQLSFEKPRISCLASSCSCRRAEVLPEALYHICHPPSDVSNTSEHFKHNQVPVWSWDSWPRDAPSAFEPLTCEQEEFEPGRLWFCHRASGGGWILSPRSGCLQHKIAMWVRFLSFHYSQWKFR